MNTFYWDFSFRKSDTAERFPEQCITVTSQACEATEYVVPRWLAELCRFELEHEHDDELAETA